MANRALKFCAWSGCSELVSGDRYCQEHSKQSQRQADERRGSANERGYTNRWQKARKIYLSHHPMCAECLFNERLTPATVVDHIIPHKGDYELFWDKDNWQPLCKKCHDKKTFTETRPNYIPLALYYPQIEKPISNVTLVCGSPGSGKTTYINNNKSDGDLVIDIENKILTKANLKTQLIERNKLLRELSKIKYNHVWVSAAAPTKKVRSHWIRQLNPIETIVLLPSIETLKNQIMNDSNRKDKDKFIMIAKNWHEKYEPMDKDIVIG
jgi:5-methylcytosine-specific restriction protein A